MLLPAKCPECGGLIEVNSEKKAANCQHCGNAFIVEDAINTFNTYYNISGDYTANHNYGEGSVVNIYEDKSKDFVIAGGVLKKYQGASLTPVVPEGVIAIEGGVFENSMITKVTLPSTLKELRCLYEEDEEGYEICTGVFSDCKVLEEVNLPDGLTIIGARTFSGCKRLLSITIPDSVTSIGDEAFISCASLTQITIPNCVTEISLNHCESLTTFVIPDSVTSIPMWAFSGCTNLKSISIPNSVKIIKKFAFSNCISLTSVTIPDSVNFIGDYAFEGCTSLESAVVPEKIVNSPRANIRLSFINAFVDTPFLNKICEEKKKEEEEKEAQKQKEDAESQKLIDERKSKGLCVFCGGSIKKGFLFEKCSKCGMLKTY